MRGSFVCIVSISLFPLKYVCIIMPQGARLFQLFFTAGAPQKTHKAPGAVSAPGACSVLWICVFRPRHLPKYARISCMRADWCTWNGQRASQCPQPTQSPACFSKLS